ncbi:MAG: PBP1A family penicillin-binding protein [Deltaproteobacteria bacterium]|nr:PBP1A family penicillin-binding protein [Deltaproteobacteria bacterium]
MAKEEAPKRKPLWQNRWFWVITLIFSMGLYLFYLDLTIRGKFEARRWNLPSRVYSDATYLFPGQRISPVRVEEKLKRLAYKRVNRMIMDVGEFYRQGRELFVFLHNFSYPSEEFTGFPVRLEFDSDSLSEIVNLQSSKELKTLKLEPELIASIFDEKMEDRTVITLSEIPEELIAAVIAIEDERFYSHHGVDPLAILRALLTDILHLKLVQGGSTLTQQLVKNYFLTSKKSFVRKFNEMLMAVILEQRYSKEEIIEAYLNEIYLGQRGPVSVAGVEEASRLYFSKRVSQLTLGESALLAGMVRSPGSYSPFHNLSQAYDRRNFVLKEMLDKELISESEHRTARKEKIIVSPQIKTPLGAPFFIDFLKTQLKENYGEQLTSEGLRIFATLDAEAQEVAEKVIQKRLAEYERDRPKVREWKEQGKALEGCLIAMDPHTGYIRSYVGGRDYSVSQFDRVSMAERQPGSAFKPFVYLAALSEEKWTAASQIEDKSFTIESGGEPWSPKNYDEEEHGTVTLREALEKSFNIATSRLAIEVGPEKIVTIAKKAGIESPIEPYPSIALGVFALTPLELARAYTIFPNNGILSEPIGITSVVTREGALLEKKSFKMHRVISHELAYLMNNLMKGVIDHGTGHAARLLGLTRLAAGKTGTTTDFRDSWFVGYSPQLLTLTWVGFDEEAETGLSGASGALPIWTDYMKEVDRSNETDFLATDEIIFVKIDQVTGKLASRKCGENYEEVFIRGTEPKEKCR